MDGLRMFLCVIFLCGTLFCEGSALCASPADENPAPAGAVPSQVAPDRGAPGTKRDDFGAVLDRLGDSRQKSYLKALKSIDDDLLKEHAALARNYGAYRTNYMRVKSDIKQGQQTPGFVMKNLQNLEAEKEKIETRIRELQKKKEGLLAEALSSYGGALPQELSLEWEKEEAAYRDDLSDIYRKIGWWMGMEYSPLWRNDEKLFWDNIRSYYRQHKRELEKQDEP